MNCYVCATEDVAAVAVATCPVCGVGLCLEHRREQARGAGGTAVECSHVIDPAPFDAAARQPDRTANETRRSE
jgi:hypothetical protein